MEQEARNAVLTRLKAALLVKEATGAADLLDRMTDALLSEDDDDGLRAMVQRHCRQYDLDAAWILQGGACDVPPDCPAALTPVFAMAATHPRTGRWQLHEIERIALVPRILGPGRFVVRMDSPALEPRIRKGAYLVVDTTQDALPAKNADTPESGDSPTAPFAMDIRGKGLVVRMLPDVRSPGRIDPDAPDAAKCRACAIVGDVGHARIVGRVVWVAQEL